MNARASRLYLRWATRGHRPLWTKGTNSGMSTVVIKRSARRPAPEIPTGEIAVEPPPEIPQNAGGRWQQALMALPMLGGSVAMAMMMGQGRGGAYSYVIGGLFGVSSIAMLTTSFGSSGSPKKAEMMAAR